jgi:hypothetical protein
MSAASDYLKQQIQEAAQFKPAVTLVTCQRSTAAAGEFSPGVACFGWGLGGNVANGPAGSDTALAFDGVYQWFSDRLVNPQVNLSEAQAFNAAARDNIGMTFALDAAQTNVALTVVLHSWGDLTWNASTEDFDPASQQLIFRGIPGAGNGAPPAIMLASFSPASPGGSPLVAKGHTSVAP